MKHPTREECEALLTEYGTPEHVKGHCRAVAKVACAIGEALNRNGSHLDLDLILAAGLLHDIARVEDKHWEVGAALMERLGYSEEGKIIKAHMRYEFDLEKETFNETDLVCLGDRLVMEDQYVGLDTRIDYIINKVKNNGHPEAEPIIREKMKQIRPFLDKIQAIIGCTIDELMKGTA